MEDKFYDEIAQGYDSLHMAEQLQKMTMIIADMGADIPKKNEKLLDVGCGTGISTSVWNCDCTGIDPSKELIDIAKKKHSKDPKKQFIVGHAEELPFPDKSFDVVICITAVHNFKDIKKGIMEMKRVCRDRLVISVMKKAQKLDEIEKLIIINFKIKKIIMEEKDLIFLCGMRQPASTKRA
ncbi:methyltransferase domain-containing protein [Candidatus Woesearchaeota archaeon]|nr:methyltransferase domain-containing protein [Candidatus Woesearchaeota archaeon]